MIEKHFIGGRNVWIKVNQVPMNRPNPNIIPTEYFTADYFLEAPDQNDITPQTIQGDDGNPKLFESPVEALSFARKELETILR